MTPQELIANYRQLENEELSHELNQNFTFFPIEVEKEATIDKNLDFRTEVVGELIADFSINDIQLIRALFKEELKCENAIERHDNLYQLCYYLYEIGQIEDVFLIYEAKFKAKHMDAGTILDREMIYLKQSIDTVIDYVKSELKKNPNLINEYPLILEDLMDLKTYPDYESVEEYTQFIRGYSGGTYTLEIDTLEKEHKKGKSWWKFW